MPKATSWDTLNLDVCSAQLFFNRPSDADSEKFAAITVEVTVQAVTTEGATRLVTQRLQPGAALDNPATASELYTRLNAINPQLATLFKDAAVDAIDEDPSV